MFPWDRWTYDDEDVVIVVKPPSKPAFPLLRIVLIPPPESQINTFLGKYVVDTFIYLQLYIWMDYQQC